MEIEEALVARLLAWPGLTALIGQRLYPEEIPQNDSLPAVFYLDISDNKVHTLTGIHRVEQPIKQFTVYAATKASAKAVANQIKLALSDYQGTLSGVQVQWIKLINELANQYKSSDGVIRTFTHDLEFQIYYEKE